MRKRRKFLLAAILIVPLLAALAWMLAPPRWFERTYKGKSLTEWGEQLFLSNPTPQEAQEAAAAIRVMCSGRIPTLAAWLSYDPGPRSARLYRSLHWLPPSFRSALQDGPLADRNERRAYTAELALAALGPEAAPAIPQIAKVFNSTNQLVAERAYFVVCQLGATGLEILLPAAADESSPGRCMEALSAIGLMKNLGTNANAVLPVLVRATRNNDPGIARVAAQALGMLRIEPATSVPTLATALTNADPKVRNNAIRALGRFGPPARSAVPSLVHCLVDPIPDVRTEATNSLRNIAPDLLTNAPAQ
jgi:hypothetical protein